MTPRERFEALTEALAAGRTVTVQTPLRVTVVTPRTAEKWAKAGRPIFKVSGESLWMASGKKYVCADYCGLTF